MSMYCYVLRVPEEMAKHIGHDNKLWDSITWQAGKTYHAREDEQRLASMSETDRAAALSRRAAKMSDELGKMQAAYEAKSEAKHARAKKYDLPPAICLDKAWEVLENGLFAIGASSGLLAGAKVGKDHGYGPPRIRNAEETAQLAALLNRYTPSDIMAKVDVTDAEKVAWSQDAAPGSFFNELLKEYYPRLRHYVNEAQTNGDRLLVWIL